VRNRALPMQFPRPTGEARPGERRLRLNVHREPPRRSIRTLAVESPTAWADRGSRARARIVDNFAMATPFIAMWSFTDRWRHSGAETISIDEATSNSGTYMARVRGNLRSARMVGRMKHTETFFAAAAQICQAVVWHCLVSHPALQRRQTKWYACPHD
jgi:hypothetical protein